MIRSIIALGTLLLLTPIFAFADCGRRVVQPQKVVVVQNHHQARKVVVVQKVVAVKVYDDHHYYSLDPYYQQQALAAQIVKQLRAELKTPQNKQGGSEQPAPEPDGEPVAGEYQNEKLLAIVNNSCAKCHGATSKQTRLVTKDGKALAKVSRGKAWEAFGLVNSGEMPKAADNLDDEAVKLFYEWAKNSKR
jgi:mono/diheme cytochrome c family protein